MRMRGLSLSEIVLSTFVLLLVVLVVFQLYPSAVASVRVSGQRMQAEALAESILSQAMEKPFHQLAVGPAAPLPTVQGRGTVFEPSLQVLAVTEPGIDPDRMRALRVRVSWRDRGMAREVVREQWRTDVQR